MSLGGPFSGIKHQSYEEVKRESIPYGGASGIGAHIHKI